MQHVGDLPPEPAPAASLIQRIRRRGAILRRYFLANVPIMFYNCSMLNRNPNSTSATILIRLGRSVEAYATGWAVLVVPAVLALLFAAGLLSLILR
jgi:hypothetical protein